MFLFEYECRPYLDISYVDNNNEYSDCFNRTSRMTDGGIEQYGYIDIKQPPTLKGRKIKSWKKRWVVLHEMSIRSASKTAAKVDVYTDERTAIRSPADKTTYILEYVTAIRTTKSKKHGQAIEVVENEPMLLLAGETEFETQTWLTALKKIFWPDLIENDEFTATLIPNEHTKRLMLEGSYTMIISPEVISIQSDTCNSYEWSLRMLKRFNLDKHEDFPNEKVLRIDCGPKSECGEASFSFRAENVAEILEAIKRNIFKAVNNKKCESSPTTTTSSVRADKPWRTSVTSSSGDESHRLRVDTLDSEDRYRELLESPIQENKRQRLDSLGSGLSRRSSEDTTSLPSKKTLSVTFKDVTNSVDELLSHTHEIKNDEDEYNRVDLKARRSSGTSANIITTFTVAKPGYQTKVLLDDKGYSHVGISVNGPVLKEDKSRSMSNISSHSSVSFRSDSTNSGDSGCQQQGMDKDRYKGQSHRSTNSFDSAVSTSSIGDPTECPIEKLNTASSITVDIQELEMTAEELNREQTKSERYHTDTVIYQDVVIDSKEEKSDIKHLVKSRSFGDVKKAENHYEELESFRKGKKNLVKHLGMDPEIDPKSVPPALPARPNSHKMKRKFKQSERKLFTLPFVKNKNKKERRRNSSTSSDSDLDEVKSQEELSISAWPLGNKSVTIGTSDIYQPVAIERYLRDDGDTLTPTIRERSSSLNLNTAIHSADLVEKSNLIWKHNRNVSMNVDLLQRMKDSDKSNLNTAFRSGFDSLQNLDSSDTVHDTPADLDETCDDDSEPIYAEVQPLSNTHPVTVDEPFPNMDSWKPPTPQPTRTGLDDTFYENDPLNNSTDADVFNQGFVSALDIKPDTNKTANLIDLSFDDHTSENKPSNTAAQIFSSVHVPLFKSSDNQSERDASSDILDLFTLGVMSPFTDIGPQVPTNIPSDTSASNHEDTVHVVKEPKQSAITLNESVYMDMSSCKNESIYVMPSVCKNAK